MPIHLGWDVRRAERVGNQVRVVSTNGDTRAADHLIYGTGYQVDIGRYPFLPPGLVRHIQRINGYPVLRSGLESSVSRLHFVGAPAAWSFGPIMRFVSGSWYASRAVQHAASGHRVSRPATDSVYPELR